MIWKGDMSKGKWMDGGFTAYLANVTDRHKQNITACLLTVSHKYDTILGQQIDLNQKARRQRFK